jgi:hypothetical protein
VSGNGNNGKLIGWLLSAVFTLLLAVGGWYVNALSVDVRDTQELGMQGGLKVAILETNVTNIERRLVRIEGIMESVDFKLDRVLGMQGRERR